MASSPAKTTGPQRGVAGERRRITAEPEALTTGATTATDAGAVAVPAPFVPQAAEVADVLTRPDLTLAMCEEEIRSTTSQYLLRVARILTVIRDRQLYREDNHSSFKKYVQNGLEMDPSYASRIIRVLPALQVLEEEDTGGTRPANEHSAQVLQKVLEGHDRNAMMEVWRETPGLKSAAALTKTAEGKGLIEPSKIISPSPEADGPAGANLVRSSFRGLMDSRRLHTLTKESPEEARTVEGVLTAVVSHLEGQTLGPAWAALRGDLNTALFEIRSGFEPE